MHFVHISVNIITKWQCAKRSVEYVIY